MSFRIGPRSRRRPAYPGTGPKRSQRPCGSTWFKTGYGPVYWRRFTVIVTNTEKPDGINRRSLLATRITVGLFIALHVLPFLLRGIHPWGLDQLKYIPAGWAWASLIAGMLLLLPPVSALLARPMDRLDGFAMSEKPKVTAVLLSLLFIAASATVFWAFRNATHFLGDGFLWANHLMQDIVFREPVSSWMYRGIYRVLNAVRIFGEVNPVRSSAITSVLAGLVYIVFAHKTSKLLSEKRGDYILALVSLLSCGTVMLFFGYVETYPPVAAGVMAFLYFSLRWLRHGGSIAPAILSFLVTVVLHLSAIALLPGLLLLLHVRAGKGIRLRTLAAVLVIVIIAGLAGLAIAREYRLFGGFFHRAFLPLFTSPSNQNISYPVLSLRALFDYTSEFLLICPLAVLLPVLLIMKSRGDKKAAAGVPADGRVNDRLFLAVCALFYFLVFAMFSKLIGTSRDWDIFSPLALPLVLWIVLLVMDLFRKRRSEFAVLVIAVIIAHTAPWIVLNTDLARSEQRFIDLCDNGYWGRRAKGYGYSTLGQYYRHYGKTLPAIQFYGKAAESDPKNVKYNYLAGEMYSNLGKHGAALEQYFKVLERKGDHLQALNNIGVSYLELGRPSEAEPYLKRAIEVDPSSISTMQNLGYIYLVTERPREAVEIYLRAVELEPANATLHVSLARAFYAFGDEESARRHIEAARSIDPGVVESLTGNPRK